MNTDAVDNRNYTVWNPNSESEHPHPRRLHTPILYYLSLLLFIGGTAAILAGTRTVTIDFWLAGLAILFLAVCALVLVNQYLYARVRRRHASNPTTPPAIKVPR